MSRKHRYIPAPFDSLEGRVVPSHAMPAVLVGGGRHWQQKVLDRQGPSIATGINQVFDAFRNDYDQARATYFTSIQNQPAPSPATTYAFAAYTTQRVSLLAQQTLSVASQARHTHNAKHLVATKIIGPRAQMPSGSLARALLETMPQPGTTAPTASLYSLSQDNAIEAARVAILNGVGHS